MKLKGREGKLKGSFRTANTLILRGKSCGFREHNNNRFGRKRHKLVSIFRSALPLL